MSIMFEKVNNIMVVKKTYQNGLRDWENYHEPHWHAKPQVPEIIHCHENQQGPHVLLDSVVECFIIYIIAIFSKFIILFVIP